MNDPRTNKATAGEQRQQKGPSAWTRLLESAMTKKLEVPGNILMVGAPGCGKKALIRALQRETKQVESEDPPAEAERVYVFDYKYIQAKRIVGEETEDAGKLNLYILNRIWESTADFLSRDILLNCLLVIVIDLSKPDKALEELSSLSQAMERLVAQLLASEDEDFQLNARKFFAEIRQRMKVPVPQVRRSIDQTITNLAPEPLP